MIPRRGRQIGASGRRLRWCAAAAGMAVFRFMAASEAPWDSALWKEIDERRGAVNFDGTLRCSFVLAEPPELKSLGWRLGLEHAVETDAFARARSVWRLTGLQSWLAPEGRDKLCWQRPGNSPLLFERGRIGRAFAEVGPPGWQIRESAPDEVEILGRNGHRWRYAKGELREIYDPRFGVLAVATQGGLLREMAAAEGGPPAPVFRADYDQAGNLTVLRVGERETHRFSWDGEFLRQWTRPDGSIVSFVYREGLLSEIAEPGKPGRRFAWAENGGWWRGDSRWPAPVHLTGDGTRSYSCELGRRGITVRSVQHDSGQTIVNSFNPVRSRLEQRCGNEARIVVFRRDAVARGALERIETPDGTLLERHRYDARGLLTGIERPGERSWIFNYDETGRFMEAKEVGP